MNVMAVKVLQSRVSWWKPVLTTEMVKETVNFLLFVLWVKWFSKGCSQTRMLWSLMQGFLLNKLAQCAAWKLNKWAGLQLFWNPIIWFIFQIVVSALVKIFKDNASACITIVNLMLPAVIHRDHFCVYAKLVSQEMAMSIVLVSVHTMYNSQQINPQFSN